VFTQIRRLRFGVFVGLFVIHAHIGFATLAPLAGITRLAAGEGSFALALRQDGVLLGWGANTTGTLGNDTTNPNLTPAPVAMPGDGGDIAAFAASTVFALALKVDGTVLGWGANGLGQLGDGTFNNRLTPVQTTGFGSGSGVTAIAVGLSHSVALKADGSVWAWGSNNQNNLGNPSVAGPSHVPIAVSNLGAGSNVVALAAGGNFTLALKSGGTVWGWGNNNNGQLGIGSMLNQPVPVQVKGPGGAGFLEGVVAISAPPATGGVFALALKADGTVWAWGINANGQLGDGTTTTRTLPIQVQGLSDVVAIEAAGAQGNQHSLALRSDGALFAWGSNANGQLGTGDNSSSAAPVPVVGLAAGSDVVEISAGTGLSLARKADGSVLAWGDNSSGQLGDGTFFGSTSPQLVTGLSAGSGIRAVVSGIPANHSFAVRDDGTLLAWGNNSAGQLGIGTTTTQRTPVNVGSLAGVVAAAAGANHSIALGADGSLWTWGDNSSGQLGIGSLVGQRTPVRVRTSTTAFLPPAISIAAANNSSYAVTVDGTVWAWGGNNTAQLGIGSTANQMFAVQVHGVSNEGFLNGAAAVATSGGTTYALRADGTVLGWGLNAGGQVGDGTTAQRTTPVQVVGLGPGSGVIAIAAIAGGAAALKSDGTVVAWGLNGGGQVGDGTTLQRSSPVPSVVDGGSGITAVIGGGLVGDGHTLAARSDGSAWSWGSNGSGQLGDGTLFQHTLPTPIPALLSGVTSVAAGAAHSVALSTDGSVRSWGANGTGQLGDGTVYTRNLTPANVLIDDVTAPAVTLSASRTRLTPPNGKMVPVTFSGKMTDVDTALDALTAVFIVTDEYGAVQPSGAVLLDRNGNYSFTLQLEAWRNEEDKDGRRYTVSVSARDRVGNLGNSQIVVIAPHDQR
jgi:alpha-tubulin suppressor-like RCC1 family protein